MTKQDFVDWKNSPVTQQVFNQLVQRVELINEYVVENVASESVVSLAEKAGMAKAFKFLLSIDYEEAHGD